MTLPLISIVTPSFQQRPYLAECLQSLHAQPRTLLEHVVVDGGSTDGSRDLIEQASSRIAWWCSEKDGGQSAALNKGLSHCTGQVFGWINSDDLLLPGALERVAKAFAANAELVVYGGRRVILAPDGSSRTAPLDDARAADALFLAPQVNQQSTFYRMEAVRSVGGLDAGLHYVMDLELWWRILFKYGTRHLLFEPVDLAVFRLHGQSKTMSASNAFRDETHMVLRAMALICGCRDLVQVMDMGVRSAVVPRAMELREEHSVLVRRMVLYFLLKWHHTVHERWQFEMMRALVRSVPVEGNDLEPAQRMRWSALHQQLDTPNWTTFRIRRKLKHWVG
ncbi:MAG: glycosyltransferase [Flavobacteriales bacterium]|nr:glycosyltransferase [Flavobacteriales bacterium]